MIEIRKSMLTLGSVLCLFVLISICYQPIIAENQIEGVKESYVSDNKVSKLNNLFIRIVKMKHQLNEDCECSKNNIIQDIICDILVLISLVIIFPFLAIDILLMPFPIIGEYIFEALINILFVVMSPIYLLRDIFDCPPVGYPPYHSYT